ncbi:hypothetical protein D9758_014317 [Tetrapyrgos nigripes]|uniref:F-box domain-containing protein n=1 Tax=Tetrapyrgos nigripes TaxID=182062 RepID=A0A8H5CAM1_9AGAR|nr:hypothetical protein D9758_014317 [Tetrapyrgos nigripes]
MPIQNFDILGSLHGNYGTYTSDIHDALKHLENAKGEAKRGEAGGKGVALWNEQRNLRRKIVLLRSLLSPIRRLPPELLGLIFSLVCVRSEIANLMEEQGEELMDCPPIRLSQVCAGWRELAWTTPSLWSSFSIGSPADLTLQHKYDQIKGIVDLHLQLSQQCPLSIHLCFLYGAYFESNCEILRLLMAHSSRWDVVSFTIDSEYLFEGHFAPVRGRLPILRSFEIFVSGGPLYSEISPESMVQDAFHIAPMLREVKITCVAPLHIPLPIRQLNHLHISNTTLGAAFECLQQATAVREITFSYRLPDDYVDDEEFQPTKLYPINLPTVDSLSLITEAANVVDVLQYMTLLGLTHLSIKAPYSREPFDYLAGPKDAIKEFFARSQCTLTSLSLCTVHIPDTELIALVQTQPSLTSLTIQEREPRKNKDHYIVLTQHFFHKMTVDPMNLQSTLLPNLKELDFRIYTGSFPMASFIDMVRSRWIPDYKQTSAPEVDCLQSVNLRVFGVRVFEDRKQLEKDLQPLRELVGLKIIVIEEDNM